MRAMGYAMLGVLGTVLLDEVLTPSPARSATPPPKPGPKPGESEHAFPPVEATGGAAFAATLPTTIADRERAILAEVERGNAVVEWTQVVSEAGGHRAVIPVMRRALAIGTPDDRFLVSVSFNAGQRIADLIGANLLTSRVADLIWRQAAVKLPVLNQPKWVTDGSMASTKRMREYAALVEQKVAGRSGLVANEGKHWVITSRNFRPPAGTGEDKPEGARGSLHNGANEGWYAANATSSTPGGEKVFQSIGLAHERNHADYSQVLVLMGTTLLVDGQPMKLSTVAADPALFRLITDEGKPLPSTRHPDIPEPGSPIPSV